jgi:repressor LexA
MGTIMAEKVESFSKRLRIGLDRKSMTQTELSIRSGVSKSSISRYLKGDWEGKQEAVYALAGALGVSVSWLMGYDVPITGVEAPGTIPAGFEPLPQMTNVPLVGSIACGTPITAEQNIEQYIGVPAAWHADFALTCHGDSMAPTICDGDIVCIRCQPEVEQGEIAAVRIGEEATLKHFHRQGDTVMLLADNAAVCPPMVYTGPQLNEIRIEGRAVGFCRGL